jgi:hypothetical protein
MEKIVGICYLQGDNYNTIYGRCLFLVAGILYIVYKKSVAAIYGMFRLETLDKPDIER